jgi:hypothetical protein
MAVALARLFYMMQGINPMTDSTKPRTLKDRLESETADTERSAAVDSERYHGGDWWQLSVTKLLNSLCVSCTKHFLHAPDRRCGPLPFRGRARA